MFGLSPAPELCRAGQVWFNVQYPLTLDELRGRLIVLDFWTACCVNCLHVLPILDRLKQYFGDRVVVISVHSPKYPAERDPKCLAYAIDRLGIRNPVVHDPNMCLWRAYGITAWPTLVFIDPDSNIVGELQGEPIADRLIAGVSEMIRLWQRDGLPTPPPLPALAPSKHDSRLAFPAKIKPLCRRGGAKRWAVADSGHHQIVLFDDDGRELQRFGSGQPGFIDGNADDSAFCSPQGLVCDEQYIFVADTGNHAIRRVDPTIGHITTLAGTGERGCILREPMHAAEAELASVWDLEVRGDRLFFANAGTHQLGELDLSTNRVMPLAGCGSEALEDGDAATAELAQPTGLALDPSGQALYFADSESSSVRRMWLGNSPRVETVVGSGLFEFGCCDGSLAAARLQHCRGLAWWNGGLIVADTYNSMLRCVDLERQRVTALTLARRKGGSGCCLAGGELSGVCSDGPDRLLVADTNHHRIIDLNVHTSTMRTWPI
jgi:Thiol-disulfide isomerase and thioredoxins